jgi:putative phosphoribosyl transferase
LDIISDRLMYKKIRDRAAGGQQLAQELLAYAKHPAAIVLGLPRGGVPVAYPIAKTLQLPLDLCLVHKLGVPGDPEVAMGAIDLQGNRWLNERIITELQIAPDEIDRVAQSELAELHRRERLYRGDRPLIALADRIVILVDDGLATGATMRSAIASIQPQQPAKIIVAVPVAFSRAVDDLLDSIDLLVCLTMPKSMQSIGAWYENFSQTSDAEVCEILARSTNC